jgi:hypothetical protein
MLFPTMPRHGSKGGITLEEAHHMLNETKAHLVRNGFVHSFSPDYEGRGNGQHVYELLVPK